MIDAAAPDDGSIVTTEAWKTERYHAGGTLFSTADALGRSCAGAIDYRGPRNSLEKLCEVTGVLRYTGCRPCWGQRIFSEGFSYKGIYEAKASIDPKMQTKGEKQNNSNKYMGSGAVQIWNRNTTVKRE